MSKSSKAASKQKNLQAKRALRAANRAKYETWKRLGENTKSTRAKRNKKSNSTTKHMHIVKFCGNPGCKKCFINSETGIYIRIKT